MDRGLASQNPNETPGSVQSAAFNHFNRIKQHQSIANLPNRQNINMDLRESQEELDGDDYNVNDANNPNYLDNNEDANFDPQQQLQDQYNKHQVRVQGPGSNVNNYVNNNLNNNATNNSSRVPVNSVLPNLVQNFSNRSPSSNNNNLSGRTPNYGGQPQDFEQLDEYYTVNDTI
jgi:hypothetical protein